MKNFIFILEIKKNFYRFGIINDFNLLSHYLLKERLMYYNICLNKNKYNDIYNIFEKKYKKLDLSTDIYEGNIFNMIDDINLINKNILDVDIDINNSEHEFYGGKSNYFKLLFKNNKYIIHCLEGDIELVNNKYIDYLIEKNILKINILYDLNDILFIEKISIHIQKVNIEHYNFFYKKNKYYIDTYKDNLSIKNKLFILFSNVLLNGELPLQIDVQNEWYDHEIKDFYSLNHKNIKIIKINGCLYELHTLKTMIPYIINFNQETKEYFFTNIYYSSLCEDHEEIDNIPKHLNKRENIFLFGEEPWLSEFNMSKYIDNFNKIKNTFNLKHNLSKHKHLFI